MKCTPSYLIFIFLWICGFAYGQQITVDDSLSPEELIQNHLISGCVEADNIESPVNGSVDNFVSYGYFERAGSNFPFENGIVLSSGEVSRVGNEQNNGIITSGTYEWGTDPAIEDALGIGNTLNATTIQFQFSAISDRIEFNYILASEEYYANFPCAFSDGFAFLIRRAGTNEPYENIALVPGTNTPVNTTTIRPEIEGFCNAQNEDYFAGFNMGDTNFNGRTEVLTAVASIEPYEVYEIKLIVADQNDTNYDTAVFIEGDSFGSVIDLGPDVQTCAPQIILDGSISNSTAEYSWFLDDVLITGANDSTYSASASGTYSVEVTIPLNNSSCRLSDEINIIIESAETSEPIPDFLQCDLNNTGIQSFDLDFKRDEIAGSLVPSDYNISFHLSSSDAEQNSDQISGNYTNTSNPETIHVRIEDLISGCLIYSTFNLIVSELPLAVTPQPLNLCAAVELNGQMAIDLNSMDLEITGGNSMLEVTYHTTPADAETGSDPLLMPYVNTLRNEVLYASVFNPETGCRNTVPVEINVFDEPEVLSGPIAYLDACDQDYDGSAIFDLTSVIPDLIANPANFTISFFETLDDAEAAINPISEEQAYLNVETNVQTIYIRIESPTSGCFTLTPLELHTNLLLSGTEVRNIDACDEDGDGYEVFNFAAIQESFINNLPGVGLSFHLSANDRDNEVNPIDISNEFTNTENPQTIYLNIYSDDCSETAEFDLTVNPVLEIQTIETLEVCDEDEDGLTILDLEEFDEAVAMGNPDYSVTYFATQEDADANTNPLPRFYENTTNPFRLYPRITSADQPCTTSNSFEVIVNLAPTTNTPAEIFICDADSDGIFEMNLTDFITEITSNPTNESISFHHSLEDAESSSNDITNTENYQAQTEIIYVRIENNASGCYSIEPLSIVINELPVVGTGGIIDQYLVCENSSDGIAEFVFATRDDAIIGDQTGKETSYYLTAEDAENRENAIDKNAPFLNTVNPQTIYVRLENVSDTSCYTIGSFEIFVSTNPDFNIPSDITLCDDMSNDGSEPIDLAEKTEEIVNGHPGIEFVTYHLSESDALNGINNLSQGFHNTSNPQQIFARIDNGTDCQSITSFVFTVIPAPSVSMPQPLAQCDTDEDGYEIFDLTASEFDIFDIRQDDLEVSYHLSFDDAESGTNNIDAPESYLHHSSEQFVYIRVTNTISNCYEILPLELMINPLPNINDFEYYEVCSASEQLVNLNLITPIAVDVPNEVIVSYHDSQNDAINNSNALDQMYFFTTTTDLYLRVETIETGCVSTYGFELLVSEPPRAYQPDPMVLCDDDYDGMLAVNLSDQTEDIIGAQFAENLEVSYHLTETDAIEGVNHLPIEYTASDADIIFARIFNVNTGCWDTTYFYIFINPLPVLNIGDQVVCIDNLPLVVSANTGTDTDTYSWSTGASSPEIEITEVGSYWVTVVTEDGCAVTETFNVSESASATIEFTEVLDFSDPNNITITVSGIGDYLYILDEGEPQESNVFEHVSLGYHTITIIDENGCAPITKEVLVIDAPKFFTPNGDGQFDTWHIVGVETLPGTEIHIFDRYGKLLKKLSWNTPGWDGFYRGSKVRADDYWYKALVKRGENSMEVSGHFALRR